MAPHSIRKPTPLDLSLMLFLTLIWASSFIAIKVAVLETGPVWLAAMRVAIGFLVLLPWTLYRGIILPTSAKSLANLLIISLLNVSIPFMLISWAELTISAGIASLLLGTGPLLSLIFSHLTTHDDKFNTFKVIGIILGFSGIALVVGHEALQSVGTGAVLSMVAVLGASLCYAISGAMIRQVKDIPPTRLATLILGFATIELIGLGLLEGVPELASISGEAWLSLLFLGLLPTGLATILRYRLIWAIGASFFSLGMNLIPVFGVILGALLLSEQVALTTWIALVLILSGLMVARTAPKDETKPD
ncbi:Threonine/homoserine efflux transporter RhtA [Cohaesibacter marisflavi]|uniref:Threonine/homoserine efflux transporter RhtA n=1 Tax=Cohaesibacter marisflavi TaxID=655353 RepID=A0A1I5G528_9HYPH|nr:DMT family transporter [Cohaesibacter marisflavi]SFO30651.1 Threonine/homoserine efflux transporter RhtA [Cohaesibacter marisflavi]